MYLKCNVTLQGPFDPTWINHRWHYYGKKYRSLRLLKSEMEYKIAKTLSTQIRKDIDSEILRELRKTF